MDNLENYLYYCGMANGLAMWKRRFCVPNRILGIFLEKFPDLDEVRRTDENVSFETDASAYTKYSDIILFDPHTIKSLEELSWYLTGLFEAKPQANKTRLIYTSSIEKSVSNIKEVCDRFGIITNISTFSGIYALTFSTKTVSKLKLEFRLDETKKIFHDFLNRKTARLVDIDKEFFQRYGSLIRKKLGEKIYNRLKYRDRKALDIDDYNKIIEFIGGNNE